MRRMLALLLAVVSLSTIQPTVAPHACTPPTFDIRHAVHPTLRQLM
jgi:hypothetical protein